MSHSSLSSKSPLPHTGFRQLSCPGSPDGFFSEIAGSRQLDADDFKNVWSPVFEVSDHIGVDPEPDWNMTYSCVLVLYISSRMEDTFQAYCSLLLHVAQTQVMADLVSCNSSDISRRQTKRLHTQGKVHMCKREQILIHTYIQIT